MRSIKYKNNMEILKSNIRSTFLKPKKGISPVIATILILIVAIISVIGFQSWINQFSNTILTDVESQDIKSNTKISVQAIVNNKLYTNSKDGSPISFLEIKDESNNIKCSFKKTNYSDIGLVGKWTFDSKNETHLIDESGNNNHGRYYNLNFTSSGCRESQCGLFNGFSSYVNITNNNNFNFSNKNFTLIAWGETKKVMGQSPDQPLIAKTYTDSSSSSGDINFAMGWWRDFRFITQFGVARSQSYETFENNLNMFVGLYTDNSHFESIVYDYKTDYIYNITTSLGVSDLGSNTQDIWIGRSVRQNSYFKGTIDEVRIYNRTLSKKELNNIFTFNNIQTNINNNNLLLSSCNLTKGERYSLLLSINGILDDIYIIPQ